MNNQDIELIMDKINETEVTYDHILEYTLEYSSIVVLVKISKN